MKATLGAKVLMTFGVVMLGVAQYYLIPFWGNDPAIAKTLMLTGTFMCYASFGYELLVRTHQACPLRQLRARRNGPTVLR